MQAVRTALLVSLLLIAAPCAAEATPRPTRPPAPPGVFTLTHTPCPVSDGACSDARAGIVYLANTRDHFTREHELGHLFDARVLAPRDHAIFTVLLGRPADTSWYAGTGNGCSVTVCPSELFADAYAACRLRTRRERYHGVKTWETAYAYYPTPQQHRRICAEMLRAYERNIGPDPARVQGSPSVTQRSGHDRNRRWLTGRI